MNWLYVTYNTVEELILTDEQGRVTPAAMKTFELIDELTLEVEIRVASATAAAKVIGERLTKRGSLPPERSF